MILLAQQVCGNYLQDPAFTKPNIPSGKYKYIKNECFSGGWCYNNAVVIDGDTIWNYPTPFPGPGDQIACIQGLHWIANTTCPIHLFWRILTQERARIPINLKTDLQDLLVPVFSKAFK